MMTDTFSKGLGEFASNKYITPGNSQFERTEGGFLAMKASDGTSYPRVNLHRAFPFTHERLYISVRDPEGKEIGMIKSLDEFPSEVVDILEEQLDRRYFAPVIQKINSAKEEFGYSYWDVLTDAGICRFTVRRGQGSITPIAGGGLVITDVDGNRFEIPNYKDLDEKSYKKLEIFL